MSKAFSLVFTSLVLGFINDSNPNYYLLFAQFCFLVSAFYYFYKALK